MRTYKTVHYPAKDVETVDKTICDICHKDIDERGYAVSSGKMECEIGVQYPEGGDYTRYEFHFHGTCFKEAIIPFMLTFGSVPTIDEVDY